VDVGRVGIWSGHFRLGRSASEAELRDAAAELEALGYPSLWIPGGAGGPVVDDVARVLDATRTLVVATGILNIWMHEPADVAADHARLQERSGGRFLLGLGVSHRPSVERAGETYDRPLAKLRAYLDALDAASPAVPADERVLAALGPKALELARDRSLGSHPYFTTPEHTAVARRALGEGPLLAPEIMVVLETDPDRARAIARRTVARYLALPNYTNNLLRHGFTEDDIAGEGSDRLVDAIVAWGDVDAVGARVRAHHEAGADHVCLQVLRDDPTALPLDEWRALAALLAG
jgi:probable F420-dependent oxidoreductase